MNTEINSACRCFGLYDENKIVGFCGVLHFPHSTNKKIKKCSRLVILPDYQGIGLGYRFLNMVAEYYKKQGYDFYITTSAKNFISKLYSSEKWKMIRLSKNKPISHSSSIKELGNTTRKNNKTASFKYCGK